MFRIIMPMCYTMFKQCLMIRIVIPICYTMIIEQVTHSTQCALQFFLSKKKKLRKTRPTQFNMIVNGES
ncbi:hypothetical protein Leryth_009979 [Lithospermum erythrorhizon]|nr:hypothetical protein Leryth_009979 [Lithospermum erythrorhizon]